MEEKIYITDVLIKALHKLCESYLQALEAKEHSFDLRKKAFGTLDFAGKASNFAEFSDVELIGRFEPEAATSDSNEG